MILVIRTSSNQEKLSLKREYHQQLIMIKLMQTIFIIIQSKVQTKNLKDLLLKLTTYKKTLIVLIPKMLVVIKVTIQIHTMSSLSNKTKINTKNPGIKCLKVLQMLRKRENLLLLITTL